MADLRALLDRLTPYRRRVRPAALASFPPFMDGELLRIDQSTTGLVETVKVIGQAVIDGRTVGDQGPKGDQGAQGPKGDQGIPGPKGDKGDQGDPGTPGRAGTDGAAGRDGEDGAPGQQGPQGIQGPAGRDGADGAAGRDGSSGAPGAAGPKGDKGDKGDTGSQGIQGPPGKDGADGAAGRDGLDGAPGPKGDKGDKGDPGPAGTGGSPGVPLPFVVADLGRDAQPSAPSQVIPKATFAAVNMVKTTDTMGNWDDVNHWFVAPAAGNYLFVISSRFVDETPAMQTVSRLMVNGIVDTNTVQWNGFSGGRNGIAVSHMRRLSPGDTVQLHMRGDAYAGDTTTMTLQLAKVRMSITQLPEATGGGGTSAPVEYLFNYNPGWVAPYPGWAPSDVAAVATKAGNVVTLSGIISGSAGVFATLPQPFWPKYSRIMAVVGEAGGHTTNRLSVSTTGELALAMSTGPTGSYSSIAVSYIAAS